MTLVLISILSTSNAGGIAGDARSTSVFVRGGDGIGGRDAGNATTVGRLTLIVL